MHISNNGLRRLGGMRGAVFWQAVRFGVVGLGLTALASGIYFVLVTCTRVSPPMALTIGTIVASVIGYFVHGRFSFRAHGARDNPAKRFVRSLATNGVGYLLNMAFVFALIDLMHLPKWTPVIGFCLVTPAVSFVLNRYWVFG